MGTAGCFKYSAIYGIRNKGPIDMNDAANSLYSPGSLVACRGRNWVVMPSGHAAVTLLRPVDGSEDDAVGIYRRLEPDAVSGASYPLPQAQRAGDLAGVLLLRDALRLSLRAGAGPFRSVGRLMVAPRPYQYVPLAMALRMGGRVRMLIADDVGVGKTIEAGIVARELLDRGIARRIGVLCPPHLCEQWANELRGKFGIDAAVAQSSRMARLERELPRPDIHVFAHYRHIVGSIDFIKSDHYRKSFADNAPDLIIVDEAHSAARPRGDEQGRQQQRHQLLRELADDPDRHIILVTATPHSGVEESFRSLLGLINRDFDLPIEQGLSNRRLVSCLVQRRRSDLANWLGAETPFPEQENAERQYAMSAEYDALYRAVLSLCQDMVSGATGRRRRVRYWAAVSILRCVLSSPAAAEATLRKRADRLQAGMTGGFVDGEEEFAAQVTDSAADQDDPADYAPTAALNDPETRLTRQEIRRMDGFLEQARRLRGPDRDAKLAECAAAVSDMLAQGYRPIVYCRFIATAEYVAGELRKLLPGEYPGLEIRSVTGGDGNDEQRREIISEIVKSERRVLVATDCLSEGINLQEHFDAVVHYDLPWNPNRLEQREGRVDRYGQTSGTVKTVLLWAANNEVDLTVLRVLIRKAREIRRRLGISVAASVVSDAVMDAVINDIIAQGGAGVQLELEMRPEVSVYHRELESAAERESRQRAYFAQEGINPEAIARELRELEPALGEPGAIRRFVTEGIQRCNGGLYSVNTGGVFELHPGDLAREIAERMHGADFPMRVSFDHHPRPGVHNVVRNGPIVSALADRILAQALSEDAAGPFARCGAIYTGAVTRRTAVLLLRLRYLLEEGGVQTYAEEIVTAAFHRIRGGLEWLPLYRNDSDDGGDGGQEETALGLLSGARPAANMTADARSRQVEQMLEVLEATPDWEGPIVARRKAELQAAHERMRGVIPGRRLRIDAKPPDVMGCYVLVPRED